MPREFQQVLPAFLVVLARTNNINNQVQSRTKPPISNCVLTTATYQRPVPSLTKCTSSQHFHSASARLLLCPSAQGILGAQNSGTSHRLKHRYCENGCHRWQCPSARCPHRPTNAHTACRRFGVLLQYKNTTTSHREEVAFLASLIVSCSAARSLHALVWLRAANMQSAWPDWRCTGAMFDSKAQELVDGVPLSNVQRSPLPATGRQCRCPSKGESCKL